jgi:hypothetical protein
MTVVRPLKADCRSILRNSGHSEVAITQAHATAGMKSRTTHNASNTSAVNSTAEAARCILRRLCVSAPGDTRGGGPGGTAGGRGIIWPLHVLLGGEDYSAYAREARRVAQFASPHILKDGDIPSLPACAGLARGTKACCGNGIDRAPRAGKADIAVLQKLSSQLFRIRQQYFNARTMALTR